MHAGLFRFGVAVTVIGAVAGCGSQSTPSSVQPPIGTRSRVNVPIGPPIAPTAGNPAMMTAEIAAALKALQRVEQTVGGFVATIETTDVGPKGTDSQTVRMQFKKPSTHFTEILRADGMKKGVKVLWRGGDTAKLKAPFLPFAVDKSLQDDALKSQNGWTFKETDVPSLFRSALSPQAQIRSLGIQSPAGKPLTMLEVRSTQMAPGVTHEVLGVDNQTGMPMSRILYKGQTVLWRMTIKTFTIKTPSESELSL